MGRAIHFAYRESKKLQILSAKEIKEREVTELLLVKYLSTLLPYFRKLTPPLPNNAQGLLILH